MKRCRDCRAEIHFAPLRGGSFAPVENPEPETFYLKLEDAGAPQVRLVVDGGRIVSGRLVTRTENGACRVEGYEMHRCVAR